MLNTIFVNDNQFQDLLDAIQGGDTSAIATALGQIKTSVDGITTALGSLSTDITQDSTQWSDLITAIGSGGGGGNVTIDSTQWTNLLTEIAKGDTTAVVTALGNINGALGNIYTALGTLSFNPTQWGNMITALQTIAGAYTVMDSTQWTNLLTSVDKGDMTATATALGNIYTRLNSIGFDTTQWTNLVNAITNQSLTVDLSNVTSDIVSNVSNVSGSSVTAALNELNVIDETTYNDSTYIDYNVCKVGNVKFIQFNNNFKITTPSGWTALKSAGGLPAKYRPANHDMYISEMLPNGDRMQLRINLDGSLSMYLSAQQTGANTSRVIFVYY